VSKDAMLPCIICGTTLTNAFGDSVNQPSEGTEFQTYGHYGSTVWDSFGGEEIAINICDECLRTRTDRIGRRKRYINIVVDEPHGPLTTRTLVGRQWINREMVPWFSGKEDDDQISIEPEEIGVLTHYDRIEWVTNWRDIKKHVVTEFAAQDGTGPCMHNRFVAECLDCGAKPLEGLR
jgi:hypothetical protein